MGQLWTWNHSVAKAMASVMFAGTTRITLGLLDLWTYPDARFAKLQGKQDKSTG
jgi:hypothetical protein